MRRSYDMNDYKLVGWIGPEPVRVDVAGVRLAPDHLTAHGSSTTADYVLTYRLLTEPSWTTRRLEVRVDGDGWSRELALRRDDDGTWSSRHTAATGDGEPVITAAEHDELDGALDCDLALCPLTNTMPVLRHGLLDASRSGDARQVDLTMAWVSVPDLEVVTSAQRYDSGVAVAGGGVQLRYQAGSFVEHIEFDADGLVVSYPSIGRRIADHSGSSDASRNAG
jgi:hypothetical protein